MTTTKAHPPKPFVPMYVDPHAKENSLARKAAVEATTTGADSAAATKVSKALRGAGLVQRYGS